MLKYISPFFMFLIGFNVMFNSILFAQGTAQKNDKRPVFYEGKLFLKVKMDSEVKLNCFTIDSRNKTPNSPLLEEIFINYGVISFHQPFKTPNSLNQRIYEITFTQIGRTEEFINALQTIGFIEYAERKPIMYSLLTPNDPKYNSNQSYLKVIKAPEAWDIFTGNESVIVAIVDDEVDRRHEDLIDVIYTNPNEIANNQIDDDVDGYIDNVQGWDMANNDNNPNPPPGANAFQFGHGTHCAGIASAKTDNGVGIASIGFDLRILPLKCSHDTSDGQQITFGYEGVDYAMEHGAKVISMSWGGSGFSATYRDIMTNAFANYGIVLVAAAGNDNVSTAFYPAAYNYVVNVASTNTNDTKASYSNYGSSIDVSAPGSNIYSCAPVGSFTQIYVNNSGTSMACPLVAGLCGVIRAYQPSLSMAQVVSCLKSSCDNIDAKNPNFIGELGSGRINAEQALICAYDMVNGTDRMGDTPFSKIDIFPNPSATILSINLNESINKQVQVSLVNVNSRTVYQNTMNSTELITINVAEFAAGLYFLRLQSNDNQYTQKIVIE